MTVIETLALRIARRAVDMWESGEPTGPGCSLIAREMERMIRKTLPKVNKVEDLLEAMDKAEVKWVEWWHGDMAACRHSAPGRPWN